MRRSRPTKPDRATTDRTRAGASDLLGDLNGRERELTVIHLLTHPPAVGEYFVQQKWKELADLAEYVEKDVPRELAFTDPALFRTLRKAITELHCRGFGAMNAPFLRQLAGKNGPARVNSREPIPRGSWWLFLKTYYRCGSGRRPPTARPVRAQNSLPNSAGVWRKPENA